MPFIRLPIAAFLVLLLLTTGGTAQTMNVGGTGGALGLLREIGVAFREATGMQVVVMPSLGTQGGVRALADGKIDIAVIARELTEAERARGLRHVLVIRTPYGFATSLPNPPSLAAEVIASYLREPRMKWPDGTPVRAVLRPPSESDYLHMFAAFPGTDSAIAALREREDIPVAASDQENLDLAESIPGSLVGTTLAQVVTERRSLQFIPVNGIRPSVEAFEAGVYPRVKPLFFVTRAAGPGATDTFMAFLASEEGQVILRRSGILR
jgi:phosphate transport system substrate-binding protein